MDAGPIIAQAAVPTRQGEATDALAARVLAFEHKIFPMAVRLIAEGKVRISSEIVHINGTPAIQDGMINPAFEAG